MGGILTMSKIINFYNQEDKRKEERIKELRRGVAEVSWELFPLLEELKELNGLKMIMVDADGLWYVNKQAVAEDFKESHKSQLEHMNKKD